MTLELPLAIALVAAAIGAVTDLTRGTIPNLLTLPVLAAALALATVVHGLPGLALALAGAALTGLVPYLGFKLGGVGGGDVKLFAAIGAWVGATTGLEILFVATIAAAIHGVIVLGVRGGLGQLARNTGRIVANLFRRRAIPLERAALTELRMGPAILVAVLWVMGGGA